MQEQTRIDMLLTYGWVRSSYAALRNLYERGIRVGITDHHRFGMCHFSRYKRGFFRTASPFAQPALYVNQIGELVRQTGAQVLLPSHDETEILAQHREALPAGTILPVAPYELLVKANDKAHVQSYAESIGIRAPRLIEWNDLGDLPRALATCEGRLVIRLRRGNSSKGVFYAASATEAIERVKNLISQYRLSPDRYPIIQEYVQAEGWGVSCLYWEGEMIASFTHRRLREKTETGGTSTYREHQPNPVIEAMAHKLLSSLKWHGLAMVEFKYAPATREAWLIEINPRLWGSIHLAISAGVEFPYLLYLAATEGPEASREYHGKAQVKCPWKSRWYLGDCIASVGKLRAGKLLEAAKVLLPGKTDTYDDVNFRDPGAFVGELCHYGHQFLVSRSVNPAEEGTLG